MTETAPDLKSFLRPGSLLADLSDDCLTSLKNEGVTRKIAKGQTIFQKADDGDFLDIVLEGRIKISTFSASGKESVLNILQAGDVAGEIAAIDGGLRTADATAIEDATLFQISSGAIQRLIEEDGEFATGMTKALCSKLRSTSEAVEAGTLDMGRRAASALLRLAEQNKEEETDDVTPIKIDQTTLAQYAGLARSNMNRALKKFERSGAAKHENGVLKITDLDWLEDFANSEDF